MSNHRQPSGEGAHLNRRQFLKALGFGAAGILAGGWSKAFAGQSNYRLRMAMSAENCTWPVLPGAESIIKRYNVAVLTGDLSVVERIPGSYLGPILRLNKGDRYSCRFTNNLLSPSIVHWHGLTLPESQDGLPQYEVQPNEAYQYDYYVSNRAGTYWYHPHPDGDTGWQVYYGMAGVLIVSDPAERALGLPRGESDVALVIQDKRVDSNNNFIYGTNPFIGTIGDRVFVNGFPEYVHEVATRVYRLRLINGSNARIYKLAWSDGTPIVVLGTDGGLLDKALTKPYVMLAPGERIELWADFRSKPVGGELVLRSLAFDGAQIGFNGAAFKNGTAIDVMKVRVVRQELDTRKLPPLLCPTAKYGMEDAVNAANPKRFTVSFDGAWLLNGGPFQLGYVGKGEIVRRNTIEVWEFVNDTGSLAVAHPIHIHGVQFQIIERRINPANAAAWDGVRQGYVDEGWKDTVMLMPGETARLLIKFGPHPGLFLYHCHNLDHEDTGMMRHYRVE